MDKIPFVSAHATFTPDSRIHHEHIYVVTVSGLLEANGTLQHYRTYIDGLSELSYIATNLGLSEAEEIELRAAMNFRESRTLRASTTVDDLDAAGFELF